MHYCVRTLLVGALLISGISVCAQTVVTIGVATSSNSFPFLFSVSGRYQTIYTAAELGVPGGSQLTEIRVRSPSSVAAGTFNGLRVRLAHSTISPSAMTNTFDSNYLTGGLTTCLGPTGFAPTLASSFYLFPLTTPFTFNATNNLLLDWSYDSRSGSGFLVHNGTGRQRLHLNSGNFQSVAGSLDTLGNWQLQFVFLIGPGLSVAVTPGTPQNVYANAQGPGGNGLGIGAFELASNSQGGCNFTGIELIASGTGNDSIAYSEVAVYRDVDSDGQFNAAVDLLAVTTPSTFAVDDGTIAFTVVSSEQIFPQSTSKKYLIVVRLAGQALPLQTFDIAVQDITVVAGSKSGVPSAVMSGLVIDPPVFDIVDVSSSTPMTVLLASANHVCQEFTISYPNGPPDKPSTISVNGLGTANEAVDLVNVQLWWDSNTSGTFSATNDQWIDTQVYAVDDGSVDFSLSGHPVFQPGQIRRYFVVYSLNTNASDQETFKCFLSGVTGTTLGGIATGLPQPSVSGTAGLEVSANVLIVSVNGPIGAITVHSNATGLTGDGALLCDVTLAAAGTGAPWTVSALTFNASGTGSHNSAYSELTLFEDTGNNSWDGGVVDQPAAASAGGFSGGAASFSLINTTINAGTSRRLFLVAKLNGTATTGQTFNANLQSINAVPPPNGAVTGVPTAASTALIIDVPTATVTNGPGQPTNITHKAGTPGNYVIAQHRVHALNGATTITGVTLTTGGSGDWGSDVDISAGIQVYLDDGDGAFSSSSDVLLYVGAGGPTVTANFNPAVNVLSGNVADLWIRVGLTSTAGSGMLSAPETFTVTVAMPADYHSSTGIFFGTPAPSGVLIGAVEFGITSFTPTTDVTQGGKSIVIQGAGLVAPLIVKIGGVVCPGTAVISGGALATGLRVPAGGATDLPIEITSGTLPPQTLQQTFSYNGTSSPKSDNDSGCRATPALNWTGTPLIGILALLMARRRAGRFKRPV